MQCIFCQNSEYQFDYLSQQIKEAKCAKDVAEIICSNCVQRIFNLSQKQLQEFQELNRKKEKAKAVNYIQEILLSKEEEINVPGKRKPQTRFSKRRRDAQTIGNFRRSS